MSAGRSEIEHADGRVELDDATTAAIQSSPLYNHDLAPVRVAQRTWTTYNFAALWISMAHCIPTYMLAASLIEAGMSWAQALVTILLGNVIVLAPILANSHPGTKYGIPFPVFARAAYGTTGANLPALLRAIVACGWFGINAWIGGKALHTFFRVLWPGWASFGGSVGGHHLGEWIAFGLFWLLNVAIIFRGMDWLRRVENWAAPFVLVMTGALVVWAIWCAHGLGEIMSRPGRFNDTAHFMRVFVPSLTAMIGFWATLSGKFTGRRYYTYTNDQGFGSYTTFDLGVGYDFGAIDVLSDAKFALNVTNLTDVRYAANFDNSVFAPTDPGGTIQVFHASAPRQVFATFGVAF